MAEGLTYCEQCGAHLRDDERPRFNIVIAFLGLLSGFCAFVVVGFVINLVATSSGSQIATGVDLAIVLLLAAVVVALISKRNIGTGFVIGLLLAMLGGFAVCTAMFAHASVT